MAKKKKPAKKKNLATKKTPTEPKANSNSRATPKSVKPIAALRRELDRLDSEILDALNRRAKIAQTIGNAKQENTQPVYDPKREAKVIQHAVKKNGGPLNDQAIRAIFREVVSGSRAVQAPTQVAYLGPEFTFSHLAALEQFGESTELIPVATISTVFEQVERGQAEFGVVPMENSTDGRVTDTLDCFSRSSLRICGELPLRIHHCLMGIGRQNELEIIHSKPQALSQCRNWLAKHLPSAAPHAVGSTAEAAVSAGANRRIAAVGSERAAVHYDLTILARNIEDNPHNITRFAVIGTVPAARTGADKTALMFEIPHQPGALADTMNVFKRNKLNMTWIESFPIPGSQGRYLFFVEFVGHQKDLHSRKAIASIEKKSVRLEVLGSYAQVEPIG